MIRRRWSAPAAVVALLVSGACTTDTRAADDSAEAARAVRDGALASARVWQQPAVPVGEANLAENPAGVWDLSAEADVECRFTKRPAGGTTPKFYCELPNGDTVKVKYGHGNPELYAEVAASRLLTALGFFADRMFVVGSVRCAGCPTFPFQALRCLERTGLERLCLPRGIDYGAVVAFPAAVLERRLDGDVIEAYDGQGWGWYELERIDEARGGAARAEVDALRLMAVFLAHWDNKGPNQRLVCPPGAMRPDGSCAQPIALIQDLGATFGPSKLDLENWRRERIWADASRCAVSMKHLPHAGATFPDAQITEGGRRLLLGLLEQVTDRQLRDLFEASRVVTHDQVNAEARDAASWVAAFKEKVRQIRNAGPCP